MTYRMAGNFRGVLIFVIFVVDLAVTKFSHPRKLMPTVESTMMGVANTSQCQATVATVIQLMESSTYSSISCYLSKFLQVVTKK